MVVKDYLAMSAGLRRASALVAIVALGVGGAKIVDQNTIPGSGFSTVATVAADPTGPPGPTGGMDGGGMNGSQFQPPQMPSSMPDYQGGNNQPPLDQNSGISIYNSGAPQAGQQVPGQQAGQQPQQPQQAQQPAHGTQIPDYQTAAPYTQGPGKANPDYQAPQQPQQGQQPQQQQPSQAPTQTQQPQNKQDDTTRQLDQKKQQCQAGMSALGNIVPQVTGGGGRSPIWFIEPSQDPGPPSPTPPCPGGCPETTQKPPAESNQDIQKQLDEMKKEQEQLKKDNEQLKKEVKDATTCDGFSKTVGIGGLVVGGIGIVASVATAPFTAGQSLWGILPSAAALGASWDSLRKCKN
ncbi:hypothetical protein MABM_26160 [Mycobacteroides abscessus]|uniref:Uncharacterized protein n=1 Tax=Mycobacteroides abscessus subsp. bolletii 50594 TaxID=1303024 RepID=A0AB33A6M2_9MYCO|nr:hypothetical protein [Mycobacteroides abscessus]AGM27384.1 hypothetical protein MASS_0782 [Mycobacteroides abscessus subsp. bolletii 50594]BBZ82700.1 hypothetical protein MABM_26160 [Mycobacteroides abscessus]